MKSFEIFFDDLTEEAQERFLEHFNMKEEDGNFELTPLAVVDMEIEEKEKEEKAVVDYSKLTLDDAL